MMTILGLIAVGVFIGWNVPQPAYARFIQSWLVAKWQNFRAKK